MTGPPVKQLSNPLIDYPKLRNKGVTQLRHDGQYLTLGHYFIGWSMVNGVELIFHETPEGQRIRGNHCMHCFYYLHQNVISAKVWGFVNDSWKEPHIEELSCDDPEVMGTEELALAFREAPSPPLLSFYDAPGFLTPPQSHPAVGPDATRACLVQCFEIWWVVRPSFSSGVFQASPASYWSSILCVSRPSKSSFQWKFDSSALVQGILNTDRPLCD